MLLCPSTGSQYSVIAPQEESNIQKRQRYSTVKDRILRTAREIDLENLINVGSEVQDRGWFKPHLA
jgi:hypothetical protein